MGKKTVFDSKEDGKKDCIW